MRGVDADGHGAVLVDGSLDRCDVARGDVDVARDLGQHLRLVVVAQAILDPRGHTLLPGSPGSLTGTLPPCLTLWMQGVIWNLGCESILALTLLSSQAQGGGDAFPLAQGHNMGSWLCTQSPGGLLPASCCHIPIPRQLCSIPGYGVTHGTTHRWRSLVPVLQEEKARDTVTKPHG